MRTVDFNICTMFTKLLVAPYPKELALLQIARCTGCPFISSTGALPSRAECFICVPQTMLQTAVSHPIGLLRMWNEPWIAGWLAIAALTFWQHWFYSWCIVCINRRKITRPTAICLKLNIRSVTKASIFSWLKHLYFKTCLFFHRKIVEVVPHNYIACNILSDHTRKTMI